MTDNDIIKALECCTGRTHEKNACAVCPFVNTDNCMRNEELALDLIKRQKAEIERLKEDIKAQDSLISSLLSIVNSNWQIAKEEAEKALETEKALMERVRNA